MKSTSFQDAVSLKQAYKHLSQGQYVQARHAAEKLLRVNKHDFGAMRVLSVACFHLGRYDQAGSYLKRCIGQRPKDPALRCELAQVHRSQGRDDKALECYDRALKLDPDNIQARAGKADVLERIGDVEGARAALARELEHGTDDDGIGVVIVRLLARAGQHDEAIALADKLLAVPPADFLSRRLLCLQIGRLQDRLGNHARAFEAFAAANQVFDFKFDPQDYEAKFDDLISTFSAANLQMLPRARTRSELPVFIACMPRSGSTLVEQIVHAHPKAFGAGEIGDLSDIVQKLPELIESPQMYPACLGDLTQSKLDALSETYLAAIRRLDRSAERITNKHLLNYQYLGMVALLFPSARVIHIQRDRVDNGLACFMAALSPLQAPWVRQLEHIGFAWRQYERLMAHWREVLDIHILDVKYEELVDDTENQIRRIIDFCGLPWDDACLRYWEAERKVKTLSYDQVNKPIFKSAVKRWEKYEQFLGPLKDALGEAPVS